MKEISTIAELKDSYRYAKLKGGDYRGLGQNKFALAAKFDLNQMEIYYNSCGDQFIEVVADVIENDGDKEHDRGRCYNMGELVDFFKKEIGRFSITFIALVWNKWRTDTDSKTIDEIVFNKY